MDGKSLPITPRIIAARKLILLLALVIAGTKIMNKFVLTYNIYDKVSNIK